MMLIGATGCDDNLSTQPQPTTPAPATRSAPGVPGELFGVQLGAVYNIPERGAGTLPVKRVTGANRFLGEGTHIYFEPTKPLPAFPFKELRRSADGAFSESSFRLYALPSIPSSVTTAAQLAGLPSEWEIATIEWSEQSDDKALAYGWASDMCKTFAVDLAREPTVVDQVLENFFECSFQDSTRELKVSSFPWPTLTLTYPKSYLDQRSSTVERKRRQLEAQEIRPYR